MWLVFWLYGYCNKTQMLRPTTGMVSFGVVPTVYFDFAVLKVMSNIWVFMEQAFTPVFKISDWTNLVKQTCARENQKCFHWVNHQTGLKGSGKILLWETVSFVLFVLCSDDCGPSFYPKVVCCLTVKGREHSKKDRTDSKMSVKVNACSDWTISHQCALKCKSLHTFCASKVSQSHWHGKKTFSYSELSLM